MSFTVLQVIGSGLLVAAMATAIIYAAVCFIVDLAREMEEHDAPGSDGAPEGDQTSRF